MTTFITLVCACRCRLGKATFVGARGTEDTATPTSEIPADVMSVYSCTARGVAGATKYHEANGKCVWLRTATHS